MKLAFDENLNNNVFRGLLLRQPDLDVIRVQDAGLAGADDPTVLEWCAKENRVLFTQDASTMIAFASERIVSGKPMPGIWVVTHSIPIAKIIEDILIIADYSLDGEWNSQIRHLPLK